MSVTNLSVRVRKFRKAFVPGPKYSLIEYERTPAQEKAFFKEQDEKFCEAMRRAIAAGSERI